MRKHFRVPPFAKNAKDGAPILLVMPAKSKARATRPVIRDQYAQTQNHRAYLAGWRRPDEQRSGGRFPIRRLDRAVSLACRVTDSKRNVRQDLRFDVGPPNLRLAGEFLAESAEESDGGPPKCGDEVRRNSQTGESGMGSVRGHWIGSCG